MTKPPTFWHLLERRTALTVETWPTSLEACQGIQHVPPVGLVCAGAGRDTALGFFGSLYDGLWVFGLGVTLLPLDGASNGLVRLFEDYRRCSSMMTWSLLA